MQLLLFCAVSESGALTYSEVIVFLEKQPDIITQYTSINTEYSTITLTGNHLVYGRKQFAAQFHVM